MIKLSFGVLLILVLTGVLGLHASEELPERVRAYLSSTPVENTYTVQTGTPVVPDFQGTVRVYRLPHVPTVIEYDVRPGQWQLYQQWSQAYWTDAVGLKTILTRPPR